MSRVPRIRFKGFEEDWEQRKLGEIADKVVEKNFQLQERDVFTNSAEFGIIDQKDFFDHEIVNKNNIGGYYVVSPNDFVYNPRISVTAPVGPINRNKLCKRGIMSPLYTVFHPRNMNEIFLEFFFKTNKWHKFMEYNGDSGARSDRFSIKTELFYAMTIPFPSHEEQSKVGICFEYLDNLITLHQSKSFWYILKSIVSCTLYWEQRKLGGVVGITSGFMSDFLLSDGKYHLTRIETIADGIVDENRVGYSNEKPDDMYLLKHGDILYSNINSISHMGKVAKYQGNSPLYHGINLLRLQPENNINSDFLLYLLNTEKCRNWAKTRANQAVSQASINQSLLTTQEIAISSFEEQKKIGDYFHNLDHLITLHQLEPYNLIFKAIAYRIIDYAKSKPPRCIK